MKDVEDSKVTQAKNKAAELTKRFRLGSHYGIERFGLVTGAVVLSGTLIIGGGLHSAHQSGLADLSTTALYTENFISSKTQVEGDVTGVYRNADDTRAMVMMKFENPADMSTRANDYYVYVSGIKGNASGGPEKVAQATVGSVITFGATGYMGVLLEAPDGFNKQLLNLTIRAKKEIVQNKGKDDGSYDTMDDSFKKYDQWRVVINPTGSEAKRSPALEAKDTIDVRTMYTEMGLRSDERDLRTQLDETLAEMKTEADRIQSYEEQMASTSIRVGNDSNVRMVPPVLPDAITGDKIDGMSNAEVMSMLDTTPVEDVPGLGEQTEEAREIDSTHPKKESVVDSTSTSNAVEPYAMNTYSLSTEHNMPGGFNFNWRDKTLKDGYLKDLVPAGKSPFDYISEISSQAEGSSTAMNDLKWPLTNGQLLNDLRNDDSVKEFEDIRKNAQAAYSKYYQLKREYQTDLLYQLLLMDLSVNGVAENAQMETGDEAVEFQ